MIQVAIPSYKRPQCLLKKTLPLLYSNGFKTEQFHVFVADEEQAAEYRAALPPDIKIIVAALGIRAARNAIHSYFPAGTNVLSMDDDIEMVSELVGGALKPANLKRMVKEAFGMTRRAGFHLWGIYPSHNPFYMDARVTTDLRFVVGCVYGFIQTDPPVLVTIEEKEDYERSIRYYQRDGGVIRFNSFAPKTKYYTEPGGLQLMRTAAREEAGANALLARYPHLVKESKGRKSGYKEIVLKDSRVKKAPKRKAAG